MWLIGLLQQKHSSDDADLSSRSPAGATARQLSSSLSSLSRGGGTGAGKNVGGKPNSTIGVSSPAATDVISEQNQFKVTRIVDS